jgi:hypothetical protein
MSDGRLRTLLITSIRNRSAGGLLVQHCRVVLTPWQSVQV